MALEENNNNTTGNFKQELEDLLNNEVVFDSFLETVEQIQEDLNQLYKKVQDEENELKELYDAYKEKIKTQQEVLQLEVQQSDELSEQIANSFLDGEIEYDHFVKHFREVRKVYHLRNAKVERIALNPSNEADNPLQMVIACPLI
ncbi:13428_t:CDS:2 [Entrophospora sp. SA101]|nr:13428_t:CDS:2 [Entrophospora sp. SA101]